MPRRRRRDDDGDTAIFTLPFQSPGWAIAYVIIPVIVSILYNRTLNGFIERDTTGAALQVIQQYGAWPLYALLAVATYGMTALCVHAWREYQDSRSY
jgi:hypothetical protein